MNRYIVFAPGYEISETEAATPAEAVTHIVFRRYSDQNVARMKIAIIKRYGSLKDFAVLIPEIDITGLSRLDQERFLELALSEEIAALKSEKPRLEHLLRARTLLDRVRPGRF